MVKIVTGKQQVDTSNMAADGSLLGLETDENKFYEQLLLQAGQTEGKDPHSAASESVLPKPGFCLKTRTDKDEKIFINMCQGDNVPAPALLSDEELLKLLEAEDEQAGQYRIPMSLGEPHAELDNKGAGCTAYDVVVNPVLLAEMNHRQVLLGFVLTVVIEGLEYKYNMALDRNWKMLKNRKFVGSLPEQNIRTSSKPFIMEMNESSQGPKKLISEVGGASDKEPAKPRAPEPAYTLLAEPPVGHPGFIVAEIHMPKVKTAESLTLDIGEDRLLLETRSNVYHLDIYVPFTLIQEECGAEFNRKSRILSVTMPVQPVF